MPDDRKQTILDDEAAEQARIEASIVADAPSVPEADVPQVSLVLSDEAEADEVAYSVAGAGPEDDFTDSDGRIVITSKPVKVPVTVADQFEDTPGVKVAD